MLIVLYSLLMLRVGCCADDQIFETKTVQVGDAVNLTCPRKSPGSYFWIKFVSGNFPKVIERPLGFEGDRTRTKKDPGIFVLSFTKAKPRDAALYYCIKTIQHNVTFLKGIYLRVEGPEPVVTTVPPPVPVHPEDHVTLQCSVLHKNKTCPSDDSVVCFSSESHRSPLGFNFSEANGGDEYEKTFCFHVHFKNFTSSDARTYFCALVSSEEIFPRNKSKVNTEGVNPCDSKRDNTVLYLLCAALAISLIVIACLVYLIKKLKKKSYMYCDAGAALRTNAPASGNQENQQTDEDSLIYSAPTFTSRKSCKTATRGTKPAEEESIYTDVKTLGLE